MALIKADRVKETSTSTGTGTIALAGAATGYRAFSAVCAVGDTLYYAIAHQTAGEWEVGLATYSAANTLTRTTVHASSNSNLAVTFSAGTKDVFLSVTKAWLDAFLTTTSATTNYVTKTTGTGTIGDSQIFDNGTNVGIGTSSPGTKLQVEGVIKAGRVDTGNEGGQFELARSSDNTSAWAIDVYGNSATTANRLRFIDNVAAAERMTIDASGNVGVGTTSLSDTVNIYSATYPYIRFTNTASAYGMRVGVEAGSFALVGVFQANMPLVFSTAGGGNNNYNERMRISAAGLVGINETSPGAQLQVTTAAAATKGLIVKGASAQSANLQEWQNSSGISLLQIPSTGDIIKNGGTDFFITTTNGYGIVYQADNNGHKFQVWAGSWVDRMVILEDGNVGIGTTSPSTKLDVAGSITSNSTSGNRLIFKRSSDNADMTYIGTDAAAETYISSIGPINLNSNWSAGLRITTFANWADSINAQNIWVKNDYLMFQKNAYAPLTRSAFNTSYFQITAANYNAIPAPTSRFEVYGDARIESQAAATKALVVRGASGQSASLQEWQNSGGTALASVGPDGSIYCPGGSFYSSATDASGAFIGVGKWLGLDGSYINIRKLYGSRVFPTTNANGDYVEIAKIVRQSTQPVTLTIHAAHGPFNGTAGKVYVFHSDYNSGNFTVAPISSRSEGDFDFDVEVIPIDPYSSAVRARRRSSGSPTGAAFMFTIEYHNYNRGGISELSGTGNSASPVGYMSAYQRIGPYVSAPPPVGGSGDGTSLTIAAASASGTGNGGSIIIQAGAYSTSGSNGKVIVRGLASNTANLQEWQNNAGTALTTIDSAGRIGAETAPDSNYSVKAAGRIYAGNDIITAAGLVTRVNAYDFTFGYGGPYIRRGFGGNSSTLYFGEDAAYQAAFEFGLGVAMPTVGVMRVTASAANTKALIVKAAASQTANLQEWQNSSGTALALVDASGNVRTTGSIQITSNTPAAFTADQNDLALTASGFQRLSGTAARNITGIAPPSGSSHVDGRMMRIYNVGSYNLTFKHNSTSSSAPNRFYNVQAIDIIVGPNDYAELIYDGTNNGSGAAGWRVA